MEPRWRRRKTARPAEIIRAALQVFVENGFAAAKLDEVARRAGVAKGSLYRYFETKEGLFRAVVQTSIAPGVHEIGSIAAAFEGPFEQLVPLLLGRAAIAMQDTELPAVVRMVIGESRIFPDLARIWHDEVVSPVIDAVAEIVARAQLRGEVREGDARLHAFSLLGPMIMAVLFNEVFLNVTREPPDLHALAALHARTALAGLLARPPVITPSTSTAR